MNSEDETEYDLLAAVDLYRESDGAEVNRALREILVRHKNYIVGTIRSVLKGKTFPDPDDILSAVVRRIYKLAGEFEPTASDNEGIKRQFRVWVGRITSYVVKEEFRQSKDTITKELIDALGRQDPGKATVHPLAKQLRRTMDRVLTEREIEVLWAWVQCQPVDGGQGRMRNEDIAGLCAKLNTTPENIRQICARAKTKLKNAFEAELTKGTIK